MDGAFTRIVHWMKEHESYHHTNGVQGNVLMYLLLYSPTHLTNSGFSKTRI
jgi:hypothetical protein